MKQHHATAVSREQNSFSFRVVVNTHDTWKRKRLKFTDYMNLLKPLLILYEVLCKNMYF